MVILEYFVSSVKKTIFNSRNHQERYDKEFEVLIVRSCSTLSSICILAAIFSDACFCLCFVSIDTTDGLLQTEAAAVAVVWTSNRVAQETILRSFSSLLFSLYLIQALCCISLTRLYGFYSYNNQTFALPPLTRRHSICESVQKNWKVKFGNLDPWAWNIRWVL